MMKNKRCIIQFSASSEEEIESELQKLKILGFQIDLKYGTNGIVLIDNNKYCVKVNVICNDSGE